MSKEIGVKAQIPNPALKLLEPLIGEWQTIGELPKFPDGVTIIGSDDEAKTYYQIYFDERGISRKYDVTITDSQIKWKRDDVHLSQRFIITIEKDRLISTGEMSRDGGDWEKDLSLTYKKL